MATQMLQMKRSNAVGADCGRSLSPFDGLDGVDWSEWGVEMIEGVVDFVSDNVGYRFNFKIILSYCKILTRFRFCNKK